MKNISSMCCICGKQPGYLMDSQLKENILWTLLHWNIQLRFDNLKKQKRMMMKD